METGSLQCRQLNQPWEFDTAYHLMCHLYADLERENFQSFIDETVPHTNLLFGLFDGGKMISVCSTHKLRLIGGEKVLWIIHMVTHEDYRSKGYGRQLTTCLEDQARSLGFHQLRVHSFSFRKRAHNFYSEHAGMPEIATVFGKRLVD